MNSYKITYTKNYNKFIRFIILYFVAMIVPILLLGISFANNWASPKTFPLKWVSIIYLIGIGVFTFFILKSKSKTATVNLTQNEISFNDADQFPYSSIVKLRAFSAKSLPFYLIQFKNGEKWILGPSKNNSEEAEEILDKMIKELKKKIKISKKDNTI